MEPEHRDTIDRSDPSCEPRGVRSNLLVGGACLLWAACFVGVTWLVKHNVVTGGLAWVVAAIPTVVSIWLLIRYVRYLRQADELERLIQLQAFAWAFGGWFFAVCSYQPFEVLGAPEIDRSTVVALLPVLFAVGTLVGRWRYR